ncbi:His/Gly/Thr/Pro-type tRNA ligase C-terminal domain-containing protein [Paenibacillus sp. yr247]|uniref:His/Gly/Thr/Pro-type tRNA ligase C-terminal domain-containing protein n=1 Tax=Paenibacillus sp. yr247 TaxID=1761880 RepID=UPI001C31DA79|nr:His/Gly/Thr/Pro-type tRNA ligase C-terminal domain-containing protein [Paenibacillus sp. yr247]
MKNGWREKNANVMLNEQAMLIRLNPEVFDEAYLMTNELELAGIAVRMADENSELSEHLITATVLGIRFVILIGKNERLIDQVRLLDMYDQQEMVMPMDQAIFVIERTYPPADFT